MRRPILVTAFGAVATLFLAVFAWHRSWRSSMTWSTSVDSPAVLSLAWRAVGRDVEPWSGVGLGQEVGRALEARGIAIAEDPASSAASSAAEIETLVARGRRLNATHVLEGTVGRRGDRSEVGMRLVRVRDGEALWSSTFWRRRDNLDTLASDLASVVAQVLEGELAPAPR